MGAQFTRSLAEILRSTLQKLEETEDFRQDDTAVIELKKHIVRAIGELEITKAAHSEEATKRAEERSRIEAPPPAAEADIVAAVAMNTTYAESPVPSTIAPETVVTEPPTEAVELPLLAENGTATAT